MTNRGSRDKGTKVVMIWPFKRNKSTALYNAVAQTSRNSLFYTKMGVPDTLDGRFEMLCLFSALVMLRLHDLDRQGKAISQDLFDKMFKQAEKSLREIGIGDMGVPKHMKRMMSGFNGRITSLERALKADNPKDELKDHLKRNLYSTKQDIAAEEIEQMADYIILYNSSLDDMDLEDLRKGRLPPVT